MKTTHSSPTGDIFMFLESILYHILSTIISFTQHSNKSNLPFQALMLLNSSLFFYINIFKQHDQQSSTSVANSVNNYSTITFLITCVLCLASAYFPMMECYAVQYCTMNIISSLQMLERPCIRNIILILSVMLVMLYGLIEKRFMESIVIFFIVFSVSSSLLFPPYTSLTRRGKDTNSDNSTQPKVFIPSIISLLTSDFIMRYIFFRLLIPSPFIAFSHTGIVGSIWSCILIKIIIFNKKVPSQGHYTLLCTILLLPYLLLEMICWKLKEEVKSASFVLWLYDFLTQEESTIPRFYFLLYWFVILLFSLPIPFMVSSSMRKVIIRKYFHVLAIVLFLPVSIYCPQLMFLSYCIAISILLLLDITRMSGIPGGGLQNVIQNYYSFFLKKEERVDYYKGGMVVSHLALLVGCALPLLIKVMFDESDNVNMIKNGDILPLSGILILGVGDSMGAIIGTYCGTIHWSSNNKRTIQGSCGMLLSMLAVIRLYSGADTVKETWWVWILVTCVEAWTRNLDNLVLPIVTIICLMI